MTEDTVERIADAVYDKLKSNALGDLQRDVAELGEAVGELSVKIDDVHRFTSATATDVEDLKNRYP